MIFKHSEGKEKGTERILHIHSSLNCAPWWPGEILQALRPSPYVPYTVPGGS